ncbi:DinB family protein [Rhodohalobacter sp. 614A]|uniref:DinB family protein n=1 Tax=Rhodohalobacter sp. 614A TaxID=2908649 RepID=UPI001F44B600|nr:DinB family protein [Rhodohalobacter sp. 614A]
MLTLLKQSLWNQFGASIDMVENAISHYPEELLESNKRLFYNIYHTLIFLDYYMTIPSKDFTSPLPFTLKEPEEIPEEALDDVIPDRFYTKTELLDYLQVSREKGYEIISNLTEKKMSERFIEEEEGGKDYPFIEILMYNMRHVQHHAAQLNLILRNEINDAPKWVRRAK